MKVTDGLKIIENGWGRKPKGFRVKYQKRIEKGLEDGYSPPAEAEPMNSDVTAWRYAWKLWRATRLDAETDALGALYNITVVDDQGQSIQFYGSGDFVIYNSTSVSE